MQESKATWCVQGNTAKVGNSQPLAVPTRQRLCSTFVLAGGSTARAVGGEEHLRSWVIFWAVGLLPLQCHAGRKDAT